MKKLVLITLAMVSLSFVSCNNEEKKAEEISIDQTVEQLTEALDTANSVAPADTANATAAH
jgi:uncharacterized lipoprotein NlpE involved in copper resistance